MYSGTSLLWTLLGQENVREVSLFQRLICTQKYVYYFGASETVLIREVSLFQRLICAQKYVYYWGLRNCQRCPLREVNSTVYVRVHVVIKVMSTSWHINLMVY